MRVPVPLRASGGAGDRSYQQRYLTPLISAVGLHGFSPGQAGAYLDFQGAGAGSVEKVHQAAGRHLPHFFFRDVDRSQGGSQVGGGFDVVEADDRDVAGDVVAGFFEGPDGPDGDEVIVREIGFRSTPCRRGKS